MKEFTLKQKSWHYWLANFGRDQWNRVDTVTDICTYIRRVIVGTLWFVTVSLFASLIVWLAAYSIGNMIGWLFMGYELEKSTFLFFSFVGGIVGAIVLVVGSVFTKEYIEERVSKSEPGFARLAYRSWKDKFCAKVVLK